MYGSDSTNTGTAWGENWFSYGKSTSTTKVSPSWRGTNAFKTYWQKNAEKYKKFTSYSKYAYHTLIIVSYEDGLICAQHTGSNDAMKLKNYNGDCIIYNM